MQTPPLFMQGCGLPQAWAGQPQWCVLETGFGMGFNFLSTWQAWKADPDRPRILHFAACETLAVSPSDLLKAAAALPFAQSRILGSLVLVDTASHKTSGAALILSAHEG